MRRRRLHPGSSTGRAGWSAAAFIVAAALVVGCGQPAGPGGGSQPAGTNAAALTLEVRQDATLGSYVAGKDGKSLYVFTMDSGGASACVADCASSWPPLVVGSLAEVTAGSGVTGQLATIKRPDGTDQVTLGGAPLYYFAADAAAGDTEGQGINDVWFLASPTGGQVGGAAASPGAEASPSSTCGGRYCY